MYLKMKYVGTALTRKGKNEEIIFETVNDYFFTVRIGIVGNMGVGRGKLKTWKPSGTSGSFIPTALWDDCVSYWKKKGYKVFSEKKMEIKSAIKSSNDTKQFAPLDNKEIQDIIDRIVAYANQSFQANYQIKIEDLEEEHFILAKKGLDFLADHYSTLSVQEFNTILINEVFFHLPRRIRNIGDLLAGGKVSKEDIITREQENFDMIYSVLRNKDYTNPSQVTFPDAYQLEWYETTEEEKYQIIKKMGPEGARFKNAWRIVNKRTASDFKDYCQKNHLLEDGISHLFHGSRNENFFSILVNGLTINPKGVPISGKAFGLGTYFAIDACKSCGYTSRLGSRWAHGNDDSGFLAIYKVATGNVSQQYIPSRTDSNITWNVLQTLQPGAQCTWYKANQEIGFRMDEIIIYQDCQSTIEYLIEITR